jgi:hypothetical protein
MDIQRNPFRSKRLIYCSYNSPDDDEFFHSVQSDPIAFADSSASLSRPLDRRFTENLCKCLLESSLLFVVIRKAPDGDEESSNHRTEGTNHESWSGWGHCSYNRQARIYEILGFREEGRRRECLFRDGRWWDEVHMGLLRGEWEKEVKTR